MKILHLIYTNGIAGAEKYLRHLLPPLKEEHGFDCHLIMVCAPGFETPLKKYCEDMVSVGIPAKLIVSSRWNFINTARIISNYLKQNEIKFIHSHLLNSDILASLIKVVFYRKMKIISTKHGYKESILKQIPAPDNIIKLRKEARRQIYYTITKWTINKSDYNYAVSSAIAHLYHDLGLTNTLMPFIHHGVTVKYIDKLTENQTYRKAVQQLIIVGRLEEFKGHFYLINAMPDILKVFPQCQLIIIGEGSELEKLRELSNTLSLKDNIEFKGFNPDPYSYVSNSDVIILPSLFEPFGLVYIEAFALKTPVVAFNTPAGNEIMKNNVSALLVPPRDSKALAEKVIYLLENPDKAAKQAERAFEEYKQFYSTPRMVENTAKFYGSL